MDYYNEIQKTIEYIERNIGEDISLEALSRHAYYSKYHYHRIFRTVAGCSLMEYVRKRRLTIASYLLTDTNMKIHDISTECGFSSQAAFNHSFLYAYGISPGEYRNENRKIVLMDKIVLSENGTSYKRPDFVLGPRFIQMDACIVAGITCVTTFEDNTERHVIPYFWDEFNARAKEIKNRVDPSIQYGLIHAGKGVNFTYMACSRIDSLYHTPAGMITRMIPGCRYAVFRYAGFVKAKKVYEMYEYIFQKWLDGSGCTFRQDGAIIEILGTDMLSSYPAYDIYIPIL